MRSEFVTQRPHFVEHLGHKYLPGESRFHAHDQNHIRMLKHRPEHSNLRSGIEAHPGGAAQVVNPLDEINRRVAPHAVPHFDVKRHALGAGFGEVFDVLVGIADHQVHIGHKSARPHQCLDYVRPHRQVRDKVAIHDVHMDQISSGSLDVRGLSSEPRKIGCEDRRGDQRQVGRMLEYIFSHIAYV